MTTEKRDNSEYVPHGRTTWPIMGMPRKVRVKGMAGVDATVIVTVVHDKVWLSISPPFTWEAIMDPAKVDEVMLNWGGSTVLTAHDARARIQPFPSLLVENRLAGQMTHHHTVVDKLPHLAPSQAVV